MANPFFIEPANVFQALMSGTQGYDRGRKTIQDNAVAEAGRLYASGDVLGAQAVAAQGGPSGLQLLMNLAQQQNANRQFGLQERQFGHQQQEAQRAQINADRQYGLQAEAARNPVIQRDEAGNIVRVDRAGTNAAVVPIAGQPAPTNPFAPSGKQTEGEANASLYARRMLNSEKTLRDVESIGTDVWERAKGYWSDKIGYNFRGPDAQKLDQAQRDFINATLRRESGAVINPDEFANARKQYFPQPGDDPATLQQKRKNRQEAISGIAGAAGKNFKPEYTFGQNGEIVRPQSAPSQQSQQQVAPVRVSSPQERDALPPGTPYVAPDGSIRTKQ